MVIAALAWNLKAWYGLLLKEPTLQQQVVRMEFKQFLERFIHLPCQIIHSGRRLLREPAAGPARSPPLP